MAIDKIDARTKRISIIGSGNAGMTAAYHLSKHGSDVCLYDAQGFHEHLDHVRLRCGIRALEEFEGDKLLFGGFEPIQLVTSSIEEAVNFADVLLMPVPSYAQEILFESMIPYLKHGQIIALLPGNYGSLVLNQLLIKRGYQHLELTFVDAISIPWACRIVGDAEIAILGIKQFLPVAVFPNDKGHATIDLLQPFFPIPLRLLENVIVAGLGNINFGAHPVYTILNMGILENFDGKFSFYHDCCSEATASVAEVLDQERLAVGRALGFRLPSDLDVMNALYGKNESNIVDFNRNSDTHKKIRSAPSSPTHRYISEDVPFLLVPCLEFARLGGVETPILEALTNLAGVFNHINYVQEGRTLQSMGLETMKIDEIVRFVS